MNKNIIGFNLTDFRVCWHKMSSNNCNHEIFVDLGNLNDDETNDYDGTFLIKNTLNNNNNNELEINKEKLNYQTLLDGLIGCCKDKEVINNLKFTKTHTKDQLIEQINLFNKYNNTKINDLFYEYNEENELIIKGLVKISWSLNKPIKLLNESVVPINFKQANNDQYDDYDYLSKTSVDDSSVVYKRKAVLGRSNTVYYKGREVRRPIRHINKDNQYFIPSYDSVSGIHINNLTTCQDAIKILFDKYYIQNSPNDYSIYKILQTGEKKELESNDIPILHRLRMGPFNEDKLFIMEKGVQINKNIDIENFLRLPENLLSGFIENIKIEENKEIEIVKRKYFSYKESLINRLKFLNASK